MRLYIKGDYAKRIPYGYLELAGKMWFPEEEQYSYSNAGDNDALQDDFSVNLRLRKDTVDERWDSVPIREGIKYRFYSHIDEHIDLEFEDSYISDYRERGDHLRIASTHRDLLTVDKRAMLIMAIEVAIAIDGQISEDDKATWLSVEEFKERHKEILALSFEVANEMSLSEISDMEDIRDSLWEEQEKRRQAYLDIHGPNPLFAEDEE